MLARFSLLPGTVSLLNKYFPSYCLSKYHSQLNPLHPLLHPPPTSTSVCLSLRSQSSPVTSQCRPADIGQTVGDVVVQSVDTHIEQGTLLSYILKYLALFAFDDVSQ